MMIVFKEVNPFSGEAKRANFMLIIKDYKDYIDYH